MERDYFQEREKEYFQLLTEIFEGESFQQYTLEEKKYYYLPHSL